VWRTRGAAVVDRNMSSVCSLPGIESQNLEVRRNNNKHFTNFKLEFSIENFTALEQVKM
jgi:hypothetical protein